jgi:hypothetical protein
MGYTDGRGLAVSTTSADALTAYEQGRCQLNAESCQICPIGRISPTLINARTPVFSPDAQTEIL